MKNELMRSKETKTRAEVATFLRALADKLDGGKVLLQQGEQEVTLDVPEDVELKIKAEEKAKGTRTRYKMECELAWYTGVLDAAPPVTIV